MVYKRRKESHDKKRSNKVPLMRKKRSAVPSSENVSGVFPSSNMSVSVKDRRDSIKTGRNACRMESHGDYKNTTMRQISFSWGTYDDTDSFLKCPKNHQNNTNLSNINSSLENSLEDVSGASSYHGRLRKRSASLHNQEDVASANFRQCKKKTASNTADPINQDSINVNDAVALGLHDAIGTSSGYCPSHSSLLHENSKNDALISAKNESGVRLYNAPQSSKKSTTDKSTKDKRHKRRKTSVDNLSDILFGDVDAIYKVKKIKRSVETGVMSDKNNRNVTNSNKSPALSDQATSAAGMFRTKKEQDDTVHVKSTSREEEENNIGCMPSKCVVQRTSSKNGLTGNKKRKNVSEKMASIKSGDKSYKIQTKYPNMGYATPCRYKKQTQKRRFKTPGTLLTSTPVSKTQKKRRNVYSNRLPDIDVFTNDLSQRPDKETQLLMPSVETKSDDTAASSSGSACSFDANLDRDFCENSELDSDSDSDSDSDLELELPVYALAPSAKQNEIKAGQLVWVKWRNFTHWPAYIRNVYNRKGKPFKLSVQFLAFDWTKGKGFGIRYNPDNVLPFHCEEKAQIMDKGKEGPYKEKFKESLSIAEDYLNKKALGTLKENEAKRFFMNESMDLDNSDYEFIKQELMGDTKSSKREVKKVVVMTPPVSDDDITSTCGSVDKEDKIIMERTKRSQKLINYIALPQTKEYLRKIWMKKRGSEKHAKFFSTSADRKGIRNPGFGPINEEHQQEELITMLRHYCNEITGTSLPGHLKVNYTIDVLVPEAVVYAITKISKCGRKKAWNLFDKGVKLTKNELKKIHESLTDMSDVSPTDLARYAEKMKNRMLDMGISEDVVSMLEF